MLKNHWLYQQFFALLACLCLFGCIKAPEEDNFKKRCVPVIEQSQQIHRPFSPLFSLKRESPPLIYAIRPLSLKETTTLLKCKKIFSQIIQIFSLRSWHLFFSQAEYTQPNYSYQFSRLNVLSSQAHPPTFIII